MIARVGINFEKLPTPGNILYSFEKVKAIENYKTKERIIGVMLMDPISKKKIAASFFDFSRVPPERLEAFLALIRKAKPEIKHLRDYAISAQYFNDAKKYCVDKMTDIDIVSAS